MDWWVEMTVTYESIATTTLGSNQASYTFTSIPQTFTNLVLTLNGQMSTGGASVYCYVNGDTANNYQGAAVYGASTTASGSAWGVTGQGLFIGSWTGFVADTPFAVKTLITRYTSSTYKKSFISEYWEPNKEVDVIAGSWYGTSPITSLQIRSNSTPLYKAGTTITLYGIKAE